jgi:hypothetical protein
MSVAYDMMTRNWSSSPDPDTFQNLVAWKKAELRGMAKVRRRASLTPTQQAEQERRVTQQAAKAVRAEISLLFAKMGAVVLARESWTIEEFSWLLLAENPADPGARPIDLVAALAQQTQQSIRAALESCVGMTLSPIHPAAKCEHQRFRATDLMRAAEERCLGYVRVLRDKLEDPKLPYRTALRQQAAQLERTHERSEEDAAASPAPPALAEPVKIPETASPSQRNAQLSSDSNAKRTRPERRAELVVAVALKDLGISPTDSRSVLELPYSTRQFREKLDQLCPVADRALLCCSNGTLKVARLDRLHRPDLPKVSLRRGAQPGELDSRQGIERIRAVSMST